MHPMMTFAIGLAVGAGLVIGIQVLLIWSMTCDLDNAGWMMEDQDR